MICTKQKLFLYVLKSSLFFCICCCARLQTMEKREPERQVMAYHLRSLEESSFFDTRFLEDTQKVYQKMKEHGFEEVNFLSPDGLNINGVLREVKHPKVKILYCAGFCPGRKEGISTFFPLFKHCMEPEDTTMLFFDARGHGKSEGRFLTDIGAYGKDEYKDVIGALELLQQKHPKVPIVIHGICAGGFHAARALAMLQNIQRIGAESQEKSKKYPIVGLVFDSSFGSVTQMIDIPGTHVQNKVLPSMLRGLFFPEKSTREVQNTCCYSVASLPVSAAFFLLKWWYGPTLCQKDMQTSLATTIGTVPCPILFIHSVDDSYVPYTTVQDLAVKSKQASVWEIEKGLSAHTCHHLKLKKAYQGNVAAFITACVQKKTLEELNGWELGGEDESEAIFSQGFTTELGKERFAKMIV